MDPENIRVDIDTRRSLREPMPNERPTRTETLWEIAFALRKRSTCLRGKVGCLIVRDFRIVAQSYNGSPPGQPHCFDLGCDVRENEHALGCQRTIHAEANAIAFAAKHGIPTEGAQMWCTHGPCLKCAQLISVAGLSELHYVLPYRLPGGLELLNSCSIPTTQHSLDG